MKPPVSLEYVVVVALLALSAAVLSYTMPDPVFSLAALLLGIYALHLVSVRIVVRQYAGAVPAKGKMARRARESMDEIKQIKEELELERRELDNRKAELQQRIVAAEQQWELLRQLIRERVEEGASVPNSVAAGSQSALTTSTVPGPTTGSDEPRRVHGRW
jgi:hypothetical protein